MMILIQVLILVSSYVILEINFKESLDRIKKDISHAK